MDSLFLLQYLSSRGVFLPIFVSSWFLVRLWRQGELFGAQEALFAVWFVVALITQLLAPNTGVWITGMLAQVALAIVLVLKKQVDDIH